MWCFTFILSTVIVLVSLSATGFSFNIDTDHPIRFSGYSNSYFGFTVSLLSNRQGFWLLVGAPKANSSLFPNIREPGEIYSCRINVLNESDSCSPLVLDQKGNDQTFIDHNKVYFDRKDYGWLGVSLDTTSVNEGRVVACGHLWANQYYQNFYLTNGICYTIDGQFWDESFDKIYPLINKNDQLYGNGGYKYAYAQMGTSAQFVKDSDQLLLGAPGIYEWKGSIVHLSREEPGIVHKRSTLRTYGTVTIPNMLSNLHHTSYFGYAVASGRFSSVDIIQYVIGAPRQDYSGHVYIAEMVKGILDVKVEKRGEQMGEYFGSSLCVVDFDGDLLDDLLVGAPFHSKSGDEGTVYVYHNKGSIHLQQSNNLFGNVSPKARFGSAITNIGDINMDGYQDVAIGAPFEDGSGAVYIYHGGANGLSSTFQQRITVKNTRGFGMSITRGMDIDNNNYLDIAVGSYDTNEAFLFRSRPLIKLSGSLTTDVTYLDMDNKKCTIGGQRLTCYNITACLRYTGKYVPSPIKFETLLEVDTLKGNNTDVTRVMIALDNGQRLARHPLSMVLKTNIESCNRYAIVALGQPSDYITPIVMKFSYQMLNSQWPSTKKFCSNCPLVDYSDVNYKISTVTIMKHCGPNDECEADLGLKAQIKDFENGQSFIVGSNNRLVLQAEISNAAERAYNTKLYVDMPKWMDIDRKPPPCDIREEESKKWLECIVANPLKANNTINMELNLNVQGIPIKEFKVKRGLLSLNVSVRSDSKEEQALLNDNRVVINLPMILEADVYVTGSTANEQALYFHDDKGNVEAGTTANFTHSFEISNAGPSPVERINIEVRYPSPLLDHKTSIVGIASVNTQQGPRDGEFGSCDVTVAQFKAAEDISSSPDHYLITDLGEGADKDKQTLRRKRDVLVDDKSNTSIADDGTKSKEYYHLNCSRGDVRCDSVKCSVGRFPGGSSAVLKITFTVDISKLKTIMNKLDAALFVTEGSISITSTPSDIQPVINRPDVTAVTTEIKPGSPPLPESLAPWIIPVSVIGGLLLLILITVALVKMGFFKRQAREDMEKLKENPSEGQPDQQSALMDS
ncbi:hypothetical protein CHUAL_002018 [Chamberlinius hualienensis]